MLLQYLAWVLSYEKIHQLVLDFNEENAGKGTCALLACLFASTVEVRAPSLLTGRYGHTLPLYREQIVLLFEVYLIRFLSLETARMSRRPQTCVDFPKVEVGLHSND